MEVPPAPEAGQPTDAVFDGIIAELHPQMLESSAAVANLQHLHGLHENGQVAGFEDGEWTETATQLLASGYPLENINGIDRQANTDDTHNVLAQWNFADRQMTFFDLHYQGVGEHEHARSLGTTVHELGHMASPFRAENDELYGGQEGRLEAAQYVADVAELSLFTKVHLNGYHKHLLEEYSVRETVFNNLLLWGSISGSEHAYHMDMARGVLYEETSAILQQMAVVDRGGLEDVEERQHRAWDDKVRMIKDPVEQVPDKVRLLTRAGMPGDKAAGADKLLLDILPDVESYDELVEHIKGLKMLFYPEGSRLVSETRDMRRDTMYYFNRAISHLGFTTVLTAEDGPDVAIIHTTEEDEDDKFSLTGLDEAA